MMDRQIRLKQNNLSYPYHIIYERSVEVPPKIIERAVSFDTSFKEKVIEALKETLHYIKEADEYITTHYPKTFNV